MITLKEMYMHEGPSALDSLSRRINDTITDSFAADNMFKQYQQFLALVDGLAGEDIEGPHTPEEVAYRRNSEVDPFFKWLLSRTKAELIAGTLDWDHLPNERNVAKMVIRAQQANAPKPVSDVKSEPMSPEDHAEKMHRGDYGKLD